MLGVGILGMRVFRSARMREVKPSDDPLCSGRETSS